MAQYFTDFSEYTTGVQPGDWSLRWAQVGTLTVQTDAGATGGKVLRHVAGSGTARRAVTWDVANATDAEIVAKFRGTSSIVRVRGLVRATGGEGSETGYIGGAQSNVALELGLGSYVGGGAFTSIGSGANYDGIGALEWHILRLRVNGTSLKLRTWADGETEPSTWQIETADSAVSTSGAIGLFFAAGGVTHELDWFGIGTNGDDAPTSAVAPDMSVAGSAVVSVAASGDLTTAAASAVKGVRVQLHNKVGTPLANVTDITALYWDASAPSGAPDFETAAASIDGSGYLTLDLDAVTAQALGGTGALQLYKAGANAQADISAFTRVTIEDIA